MKDEDVEIVKMDASSNDVSGPFEVRGFPTLYWAAKDSKSNPVRYEVLLLFIFSSRIDGFFTVSSTSVPCFILPFLCVTVHCSITDLLFIPTTQS